MGYCVTQRLEQQPSGKLPSTPASNTSLFLAHLFSYLFKKLANGICTSPEQTCETGQISKPLRNVCIKVHAQPVMHGCSDGWAAMDAPSRMCVFPLELLLKGIKPISYVRSCPSL